MNILITGYSQGIGRKLTEGLMADGHRLWGFSRSAPFIHPDLSFIKGSVGSLHDCRMVADHVRRGWGSLDAIICCAGEIGPIGPTLSVNPTAWAACIDTNLIGTLNTLHAFAPLLTGSRRGKIVCFSGGGAVSVKPNFSAYACSKAAVMRLVETIAFEEPSLDINAVAPGAISTSMTEAILAAQMAGTEAHDEARNVKATGGASIERVKALVGWLISEASDGVTGRLIAAQWEDWRALRP